MSEEQSIGKVAEASGQVTVRGEDGVRTVEPGDSIFKGDMIVTSDGSDVQIEFEDGTRVGLGENSRAEIDDYVFDADDPDASNFVMDVGRGAMRCVTGQIADQNPDHFNVETPLASIGIRGTVFGVVVNDDGQGDFWVENLGEGHTVVFQDSEGRVRIISEPDNGFSMFEGEDISEAPTLTLEQVRTLMGRAPMDNTGGDRPDDEGEDSEEGEQKAEDSGEEEEAEGENEDDGEDESKEETEKEGSNQENDDGEDGDNGDDNQAENDTGLQSDSTPNYLSEQIIEGPVQDDGFGDEGSEDASFEDVGDFGENAGEDFSEASNESDTDDNFDGDTDGQVDEPPEAENMAVTTLEDHAVSGNLSASDPNGLSLIFNLAEAPDYGKVSVNQDGSFRYDPAPDYYGNDSFKYAVKDAAGNSDSAEVSVTVLAVEDPPVADDMSVSTREDTLVADEFKAEDPDGDNLSFSIVADPAHGSLVIENGGFTYTPVSDYFGGDSFVYKAEDPSGQSDTGTVNVDVAGVNDPPVADDMSVSTEENTALTKDFIANDPDGDSLIFTVLQGPSHGSVEVNPDGKFTYTPDDEYEGNDSFEYQVEDAEGLKDSATVLIEVLDVNKPPEANDKSFTVTSGNSYSGSVTATDPDEDALEYSINSNPSYAHSFSFNSDGSFSYIPDSNYTGSDQFTFTVDDGEGGIDTGEVSVTINPNYIYGDASSNTLTGTSYVDYIYGYESDDTLEGKAGNDYLDGGSNSVFSRGDAATYANDPASIIVTKSASIFEVQDGYGNTDTLNDIEYILGSDYADTFNGDGSEVIFIGRGGDDFIDGGLSGSTSKGPGAGVSYAQTEGSVSVDFSGFSDYSASISVSNVYNSTSYSDTVEGVNTLIGSQFSDDITGHDGIADYIMGLEGTDNLDGGAFDFTSSGPVNELSFAGDGGSGVSLQFGYSSGTYTGTADDSWGDSNNLDNFNVFVGTEHNDVFELDSSNDDPDDIQWTFISSEGNDSYTNLAPGKNDDLRVSYIDDPAGINFYYSGAEYKVTDGWNDTDTLDNIYEIEGSKYNDVLDNSGGVADINFIGSFGDDTITGNGNDIVTYAELNDIDHMQIDLSSSYAGAKDSCGSEIFVDSLTGFNKLQGSYFNDNITGNNDVNQLYGLEGNDTIDGGDSNDEIYGGSGDDQLIGGPGADTITTGMGNDSVVFNAASEFGDTVTDFVAGGSEDVLDINVAVSGGNYAAYTGPEALDFGVNAVNVIQADSANVSSSMTPAEVKSASISGFTNIEAGEVSYIALSQNAAAASNVEVYKAIANAFGDDLASVEHVVTLENVIINDMTADDFEGFSASAGNTLVTTGPGFDTTSGTNIQSGLTASSANNTIEVSAASHLDGNSTIDGVGGENTLSLTASEAYNLTLGDLGDPMTTYIDYLNIDTGGNMVTMQASQHLNFSSITASGFADEVTFTDAATGGMMPLSAAPQVEVYYLYDGPSNWFNCSTSGQAVYGGTDADDITGSTGEDVLVGGGGADNLAGGGGDDIFVLTDSSAADNISDFMQSADADLLRFMESDLGFTSQGTVGEYIMAAGSVVNTEYRNVISFNTINVLSDWSNVGNEINSKTTGSGNSYFVANNGTDARVYSWTDSDSDGDVENAELSRLAQFSGIQNIDIEDMSASNFDIMT